MQLVLLLSSLAIAEAHWWNHHHHGHHGGHNKDECGAAVTARHTEPAKSIRQADCSSFMTSTVTPPPVTATAFIPGSVPKLRKRQDPGDSVDSIPEYAIDACSDDPSLYSSACDAWGIYEDTITLPAETTTVTVDNHLTSPEPTPTSTPIESIPDNQSTGDGIVTIQSTVTFIATTIDITITVDPSGIIVSEATVPADAQTSTEVEDTSSSAETAEATLESTVSGGILTTTQVADASSSAETAQATSELEVSGETSAGTLVSESASAELPQTTLESSIFDSTGPATAESSVGSPNTSIEPTPIVTVSEQPVPSSSDVSGESSASQSISATGPIISTIASEASIILATTLPPSSFVAPTSDSPVSSSTGAQPTVITKPVSPVVGSCPNPVSCRSSSACSADHHCLCQPSVEGIGYCLADTPCSQLTNCVTDAECGDGSTCMITCCASNKCLDLPFLCPNPGTPLRLFAKKDIEERDVPTTNGVDYSGLGKRQDDEGTSNAVPPGYKAKKNRAEHARRLGGGL